jgi:MerR family copper efflux transcriptional regulator
MRITAAAQRLGISPRMLRYREFLGLLPVVRNPRRSRSAGPGSAGPAAAAGPAVPADAGSPRHRRFEAADLDAVALGLSIERRYDISPAALAFGVQVLADPRVRADVAELGRRIGRIQPQPARALDFEKERALRLLSLSGPVQRFPRGPQLPPSRQ